MRDTSEFYVDELGTRAKGEVNHIILLFVISAITLIAMLVILFPVVRSVNAARLKILSLFIDIPYSIAITLSAKCQKFINAQLNSSKQEEEDDKTVANSDDNDNRKDEDGT